MIRKLFFAIAASLLLVVGCETTSTLDYDNSTTPKITTSAGFNQETFVWEQFLFPTNRTSGVQ